MRLFWSHIFALVFGGVISITSFLTLSEPRTEEIFVRDTLYASDTIYVQKPPISVTEYITKLDTIYITVNDTLVLTEVASMDTSLEEGRLSISYLYIPRRFDINWSPYAVPVITNTVKEYIPYIDKSDKMKYAAYGYFAGTIITIALAGALR